MSRIRFVGDSPTCAWLGVNFMRGEWITHHALDAEQLSRLADHPHFEVARGSADPRPSTPTRRA